MARPKSAVLILSSQDDQQFYRNLPLAGEELVLAGHGEALCAMVRRDVDLILLDSGFHPKLGLEIARSLKKRHPAIPILFATERSSEDTVIRAFQIGVRSYLRKPLSPFGLRDLIAQLLRVKRESMERRAGLELSDLVGEYCPWPTLDQPLSAPIMRVMNYVESHFHEPVTLAGLAEIACSSPSHFSRAFRRAIGMAPLQYVKYLRIQRAKAILKCEQLSISAVATRVGFRDVSNFNKNFRRFEGITPTVYRLSAQKGTAPMRD